MPFFPKPQMTKKTYKIRYLLIISFFILPMFFSTVSCKTPVAPIAGGSLKEVYSEYFDIGATVSSEITENRKLAKMILFHFNSLSFDSFTFRNIHPEEGTYNFDKVENMVEFAEQNKIKFRPSPLIDAQNNTMPQWFTTRCSPMNLKLRSIDHIFTVTTHFRHSASEWIIVRGALADPQSPDVYDKEKILYKKARSQKYIFDSFTEASQNRYIKSKLYSDYDLCNPAKREKAIKLIKTLRQNGTPINGIIIEANNWTTTSPTLSEIETTIDDFSEMNIDIHFSDMEISGKNSEAISKRYSQIFEILRKKHRYIKSVSFGGINASELFDKNLRPNSNFNAVIDF